jgi:hypothetical protein
MHNCGCNSTPISPISICDPCNTDTGCPIQLDWDCSIYHKSNNEVANLPNLGLTNGATLNLFAELVDSYIGDLKVQDYALPCLRADYTINTLAQFANAVDTEICSLNSDISTVMGLVNTNITAVDTATIDFTTSGTLNHTIQATVIVSGLPDNQLAALPSGLFASAQNLSINYTTHEITISDGNTIDLTPLMFNADGFLGNVASDPASPLNGQYWFRTDLAAANGLRIRVNGTTRTIPTV